MKLLGTILGAALTQRGITDRDGIKEVKKSMFLQDLEDLASHELSDRMDLEGFDISEKIDEAVDAYRSDFPDKDEHFSLLANEVYTVGENGAIERTEADQFGLTLKDKEHIMNYLQLKLVILFTQRNKFLGKYCFYGCWCFPHGTGLESGYGVPVDNIDRSCREYTTCYNCIHNQQLLGAKCDGNMFQRYSIGGSLNPANGEIQLFCTDPIDSCLRARCECDVHLANNLRKFEHEWNMNNHHKWGQPAFNREAVCGVPGQNPWQEMANSIKAPEGAKFAANQQDLAAVISAVGNRPGGNGGGNGGGGNGGKSPKSPVPSAPIYGHIIGCCGRPPFVHVYREGQKCCSDGEIVDQKAPCSVELFMV